MLPDARPENELSAIVDCNKCEYWGAMEGFRQYADNGAVRAIFLCPECSTDVVVKWF